LAIDTSSLEGATDEALVVAFQDGDCDAFTQIVQTYHGVLFARARRQLRSADDAQDAVQETLLRAYRYLPNFAGQYHLAAWLNRILSNVIADAKRQHGVEVRLNARLAGVRDVERVPEEFITESPVNREVSATVQSAIASLSSAHRDAFMLRAVEDQTYAEIAEVLDISEVNARARVHRARTNLQRTLRTTQGSMGLALISFRGHVAQLFSRTFGRGSSTASTSSQLGVASSVSAPSIGVSQTVTQVLSSPTGQALTTIVSESSRSILPVSGTFATLITSAAVAVVAPATVLLAPVAANQMPAAAASHIAMARSVIPAGALAAAAASSTTTSSSAVAPATSTTSTTPAADTSTPQSGAPKPTATTPWSWVGATSSAGAPTTAGSTIGPAVAGPPLAACPYLQSFPDATPSQVSLPPAQSSGPAATDYLSSGTVTLPSVGPSFDVTSLGTLSSGSQTSAMHVLFGACLPTTSTPALVANVTNNNSPNAGELQLRGALASSTTNGGETDTYYRGTAVWLSGPELGSAPVVFVADVASEIPNNTVNLHVAFFGSVSSLLDSSQPGCAASNDAAGGTSTDMSPTSNNPVDASATDPSATSPATDPNAASDCPTPAGSPGS
jgi:RNA polymerase sigma-70 factor (ECF subfamily)